MGSYYTKPEEIQVTPSWDLSSSTITFPNLTADSKIEWYYSPDHESLEPLAEKLCDPDWEWSVFSSERLRIIDASIMETLRNRNTMYVSN